MFGCVCKHPRVRATQERKRDTREGLTGGRKVGNIEIHELVYLPVQGWRSGTGSRKEPRRTEEQRNRGESREERVENGEERRE